MNTGSLKNRQIQKDYFGVTKARCWLVMFRANICWQGIRPQIDGSSKITAFYPPIAVDQRIGLKEESCIGILCPGRRMPPLTEGLFWHSSCPPFLLSSSARPSLVVLGNY